MAPSEEQRLASSLREGESEEILSNARAMFSRGRDIRKGKADMLMIKSLAESMIQRILRARNVPAARWPELVKKTGRGMILLGVASVVPLLLVDEMPLSATIALQTGYAILVCVGVLLAFESKAPANPSRR